MKNDKKILNPNKKEKEAFDAEKTQADFDEFMKKYMSNQNKKNKIDRNSNDLGGED